MSCSAQRSASQYQVKMHSTPTTRSSRNGSTASRKASGSAGRFRWSLTSALVIEDADVHGSGVQIDAAVVLMGVGEESHWVPSFLGDGWRHPSHTARWAEEGASMSIKSLHLTKPLVTRLACARPAPIAFAG